MIGELITFLVFAIQGAILLDSVVREVDELIPYFLDIIVVG